jgi:hypothetical protein
MTDLIATFWPMAMAFVAFFVWLIRLEARRRTLCRFLGRLGGKL